MREAGASYSELVPARLRDKASRGPSRCAEMAVRAAAKRADLGAVGLSARAVEALLLRTMTDTVAHTILVSRL